MRTLRVPDPEALYERDFYAWTLAQVAELRRLPAERRNSGLDMKNLADEVAGLGRGERDTVRSHVETVIAHLLKLDYSPAGGPRLGWIRTILRSRDRVARRLTAALHRDVERHLDLLYRSARLEAAGDLVEHGELEAARGLPAACPYSLDNVLRDGWYSTAEAPDLVP
jgi:Domain of unknown function DUF29